MTLTAAIRGYLERTNSRRVTCQELAAGVANQLGHTPSLMAVSRIMGGEPGWNKVQLAGKVGFEKEH
jgi:hypothetical protein